jgi:hypothetical protein
VKDTLEQSGQVLGLELLSNTPAEYWLLYTLIVIMQHWIDWMLETDILHILRLLLIATPSFSSVQKMLLISSCL